jgi:hypothetical protein
MPSGIYKRIKPYHYPTLGKHWKLSEKTKEKMSLASKGKTKSVEHRKRMSLAWTGTKQTKETIEKRVAQLRGENHWRWIKDRTKLKKSERKDLDVQYIYWVKEVKNRDKWTCRIADDNCKGRLEAHHILDYKHYPELRYDINNGITLCHAHHPRGREREAKLSPYFKELVAKMK